MELIKGDINKLGNFRHFQLELNSLPLNIKTKFQSYIKSLELYGEVETANIQVIIEGFVKVK